MITLNVPFDAITMCLFNKPVAKPTEETSTGPPNVSTTVPTSKFSSYVCGMVLGCLCARLVQR